MTRYTRLRDIDRRITELANRLTWIDEHGTRGVGTIQSQLTEQAKDIAKLETLIDALQRSVSVRQTAIFLSAILPIYVLLILSLVTGHP